MYISIEREAIMNNSRTEEELVTQYTHTALDDLSVEVAR